MTATPLENHPMECYEILDVLHLSDLWSLRVFEQQFVTWSGYGAQRKPVGLTVSHAPAFRAYIDRHALQRTSENACLTLPPIQPEEVWVPLAPAQQAAYDRAANVRGLRGYQDRERAIRVRDGEFAQGEYALGWLQRHYEVRKAILYAYHLATLDHVAARLAELGIGFARIDGKATPSKSAERQRQLDRFRDDPTVRVLLGNEVLGTGLNLQHASALLTLGRSDNPAKEEPRERRICRIGSPHPFVWHVTLIADVP